jgi:hypothetical protein
MCEMMGTEYTILLGYTSVSLKIKMAKIAQLMVKSTAR